MKLKSFSSTATLILIATLFLGNNLLAQRNLPEKKPDLVLLAVSVKKESTDQLNVIWSIQNQGDVAALEVDKLLSFIIEGSNKPNSPSANHIWEPKLGRVALNLSKTELKPGEILRGNTILPYIEQENLVSLRVSIDVNDDFYELKKDNNTLVTQLVGK
jgi:CARDB